MLYESVAKFIASIIASTSPITEEGFHALIENITKFTLMPQEDIPEAKKELPAGGYEVAMQFFKGLEGKK